MNVWKNYPWDRSLKDSSNYCVLVNAVVYDGLRYEGNLGKLYEEDQLFQTYSESPSVLNRDILCVIIEFFSTDDGIGWELLRQEAISKEFRPFTYEYSPKEYWDWCTEFRWFKKVERLIEGLRSKYGDPDLGGYNVLDEYFCIFCAKHFDNFDNHRTLPSWLAQKLEKFHPLRVVHPELLVKSTRVRKDESLTNQDYPAFDIPNWYSVEQTVEHTVDDSKWRTFVKQASGAYS